MTHHYYTAVRAAEARAARRERVRTLLSSLASVGLSIMKDVIQALTGPREPGLMSPRIDPTFSAEFTALMGGARENSLEVIAARVYDRAFRLVPCPHCGEHEIPRWVAHL